MDKDGQIVFRAKQSSIDAVKEAAKERGITYSEACRMIFNAGFPIVFQKKRS